MTQHAKFKERPSNWRAFISDALLGLAWTWLVGFPLYVLHMVVLDYEHYIHGIYPSFSLSESLSEIFPHHPLSLTLWLGVTWIAVLGVRRTLRHREQMAVLREHLTLSQTQALKDGLTGAWNRKGFEQILKSTLERAQQSQQAFSILLADVDGLKSYNDSFGHPAADQALRTIAQILIDNLRVVDAVARYGGDEFVVFCPQLDREGAERLVTRFSVALKTAPLSLSFGIATFPLDGNTATELINIADHRLYEAKARQHARQRPPNHAPDCLCIECKCAVATPSSQTHSCSKDAQ